MASTPLYKSLKVNGTSFYAFPGASEDISAAYQNSNYKMYFTKFALLNFPKQNLNEGGSTSSTPIKFDFDTSFSRSSTATATTKFGDAVVESLRNYVANQETVIRESRLNDNQYYYNTNTVDPDFDIDGSLEFDDDMALDTPDAQFSGLTITRPGRDTRRWLKGYNIL